MTASKRCPMCAQQSIVEMDGTGHTMCGHCDQPCEKGGTCKGCRAARAWIGRPKAK